MIISHKYKFIFIHNPRTGGTNMTRALLPLLGEDWIQSAQGFPYPYHLSASDLWRRIPPDIWRDYFKFSFIRNPWDKLVSHYHYLSQTSDMEHIVSGFHLKFNETFSSFNEWLRHLYNRERRMNWKDYWDHFISGLLRQGTMTFRLWMASNSLLWFSNARVVMDARDHLLVDHLGRFENLVDDFAAICERLHINAALTNRNRNKSSHEKYRSYYTEETEGIIENILKRDIVSFGYHF